MKINEIRVGDIVRATRRDNPKIVFRGEVTDIDGEWVHVRYAYPLNNSNWLFELVSRPVELPTEPGLYTVTPEYFNDSLECYRVFRLTEEDGWSELFSEEEVASVMRDDLTVENFSGRLRKLEVVDE